MLAGYKPQIKLWSVFNSDAYDDRVFDDPNWCNPEGWGNCNQIKVQNSNVVGKIAWLKDTKTN